MKVVWLLIFLFATLSAFSMTTQEIQDTASKLLKISGKWSNLIALSSDLNGDGIKDIALINESLAPVAEGDAAPRMLVIILLDKDNKAVYTTYSQYAILLANEGGMMGDPLQDMEVMSNCLVLRFFGGSREKWSQNYVFQYIKDGFYLIALTTMVFDSYDGSEEWKEYDFVKRGLVVTKVSPKSKKNSVIQNLSQKELLNLKDFVASDFDPKIN